MRYIYSGLLYLLSPLIILYLKKRAKKNQNYNLFWQERFGINLKNNIDKPIIWIHAVSVGETRAIAKIVEMLSKEFSKYQILITQMTPTGRQTAEKLYPNVNLHYLPYDMPHAIINFYKTFKPALGLIMETEIWPNLIHYAKKYKIPLYLVNARLSDRSFKSYNRVKFLITPILNNLTGILCQNDSTYLNFMKLGYKNYIENVGSTKFDLVFDDNQLELSKFLAKNLDNKKLISFTSTRDGEEDLIINNIIKNPSDIIYIIIPRHPERFIEVENLLLDHKIKYQKRSSNKPIRPDIQVFLGDSLGEMMAYLHLSYLSVIGGSFTDCGGQNPIESIYAEVPVIFGLSTYNFSTVFTDALDFNCAIQVKNIDECFYQIKLLLDNTNEYKELKENCSLFINKYKGSSEKIIKIVSKHL